MTPLQETRAGGIAARLTEGKVLKSTVAETLCHPAHSTDWAPQPATSGSMRAQVDNFFFRTLANQHSCVHSLVFHLGKSLHYTNETETLAQSRAKQLTEMWDATHTNKRQYCRQLLAYVLPGRMQRKWETLVGTKFVCYNLLFSWSSKKNVLFNQDSKVLLLSNHGHLF